MSYSFSVDEHSLIWKDTMIWPTSRKYILAYMYMYSSFCLLP